MLVRLIYASRALEPIAGPLVDAITAKAHAYNPQHGITGILCYSGDIFLQVLEGGRGAINALYGNILRDPRHHSIELLDYDEIAERRYCGWTMGQVNLDKVNLSIVLKYSERPVIDPFVLPGKVTAALLEELISSAAIIGRGEGNRTRCG